MPADQLAGVLDAGAIRLGRRAAGKADALRQSGALLAGIGAVDPAYTEAMFAREAMVSTYLGEGVAIPHGTNEARTLVHRTALGYLQFPDGVDWGDGATVHLCIPIAAAGGEHLSLLSALAGVLVDPAKARALRSADSADAVLAVLASAADQDEEEAGDARENRDAEENEDEGESPR